MKERYQPKYMKPERKKRRLPLSAYLTYVLIAVLLLTGVSFSKFASTGDGSEGASVAVVMLDTYQAADQSNELAINISGSGEEKVSEEYHFYVQNYKGDDRSTVSQVELKYDLTFVFPEKLPDGISVSLRQNSGAAVTLTTEDGLTYTAEGFDTLPAGSAQQHAYRLVFMADKATLQSDGEMENVKISVHAEQAN